MYVNARNNGTISELPSKTEVNEHLMNLKEKQLLNNKKRVIDEIIQNVDVLYL
jgi:hypothetical protein